MTEAIAAGGVTLLTASSARMSDDEAQALRSLQLRVFATDRSTAFASVLHVLLDNSFRATHADASTGFIAAVGPGTEHLRLGLGGLSRHTDTAEASVFVEQVAPRLVQVRIGFSAVNTGTAAGAEARTRFAEQHQLFFAQLQSEITQRQAHANTDAPFPADSMISLDRGSAHID
jgi:hypothetical protein